MKKIVAEIAGWYGMTATLAAYFLISYALIGPGLLFQVLNLTGAGGLALISLRKKAYPCWHWILSGRLSLSSP